MLLGVVGNLFGAVPDNPQSGLSGTAPNYIHAAVSFIKPECLIFSFEKHISQFCFTMLFDKLTKEDVAGWYKIDHAAPPFIEMTFAVSLAGFSAQNFAHVSMR